MKKGSFMYEGKAKRIYQTDHPEQFWVEYKDDATAFNGEKKGSIMGKGKLNNYISSSFFTLLKENGVKNHFIQRLSDHEQLVRKVEVIPVEVVVRNYAAGSMAKRLGIEEGKALPSPIVEFYYKNDDLGDPIITEDHVYILQLAEPHQLQKLKSEALKINQILTNDLKSKKIKLVDFKLEFGLTSEGEIILADEISPDTCRFWDSETNEKLDKDRFRRDLGGVEEAYQEILNRVGGENHDI